MQRIGMRWHQWEVRLWPFRRLDESILNKEWKRIWLQLPLLYANKVLSHWSTIFVRILIGKISVNPHTDMYVIIIIHILTAGSSARTAWYVKKFLSAKPIICSFFKRDAIEAVDFGCEGQKFLNLSVQVWTNSHLDFTDKVDVIKVTSTSAQNEIFGTQWICLSDFFVLLQPLVPRLQVAERKIFWSVDADLPIHRVHVLYV